MAVYFFFSGGCALSLAMPTLSGHCLDPASHVTAPLSWQLLWAGLIALSYADVSIVQRHSWNNSYSPTPYYCYLHCWLSPATYLLNMKTGPEQGMLGDLHCMQRSWSAADKRPQLPNERQLHHCLHVTDGWYRWQTGGINWRGYQEETSLRFRASPFYLSLVVPVSRCIFIQMQTGWVELLAWRTCFVKVIKYKPAYLPVSVVWIYKGYKDFCLTGLLRAEWMCIKQTHEEQLN